MVDVNCKCGKKLATKDNKGFRIANEMLINMVDGRGLDKDTTEFGIRCPTCKEIKYIIV